MDSVWKIIVINSKEVWLLLFGSVVITDGKFKGRIGNYDDDHFIPTDPNYEWS